MNDSKRRVQSGAGADGRARRLVRRTLVWDNHGCMPLRPHDTAFLPQLARYAKAGVDVVSLNVGFDAVAWENTPQMLAQFRHWVRSHPRRYKLVETVADIRRAHRERRLGVFFDIEGGGALNGQLEMVELYRDLGVRWMLIAYNRNNRLGGGCMDVDRGLTRFGRRVVTEMERVGMTVCCSHTGYRTTMDVMRHATKPVIFSHSNPLGVWRHKRNIRDEAIRACAQTGGVIGINGIGIFLGTNDNRPETVVEHIDYVAQLVGPGHVGLGLDFTFDMAEAEQYAKDHPETFPPEQGFTDGMRIVAPESLAAIVAGLLGRGYRLADLRGILGGNFLRAAQATWPASGS
jgi:membrane dipeptidase